MKVLKKAVAVVFFLLLGAGLIFAGGGAQPQSAAAASGPEKVYLYHWSHPDNVAALLAAFNKEFAGKYELVYERMPDGENMTINTILNSGADVSVMTQGSAFNLGQRAEAGVYLGLKKFLDRENMNFAQTFGTYNEEVYNYKGDYYATPYCTNIRMMFFNKKMFDDAGIPYPDPNWTWNDFREIAKKLTKGSGANKIYGANLNITSTGAQGLNSNIWPVIAQQRLGNFWYYNPDFRSIRFDRPEIKESLQFFYDMAMVDQSCVPIEELRALKYDTDTPAIGALAAGKFAMAPLPVYAALYLGPNYNQVDPGTYIGMTNYPRPVGSSGPVCISYTSQAAIPANVRDPEAAWTLLKYITIDHPEYFAGPKAMHPGVILKTPEAIRNFDELIFKGKPGLDSDMAIKNMELPRALVSTDNTILQGQGKINDLIIANVSLVFNGEMGVDQALQDLKTKGDQYIAEDLKTMGR